MLGRIVDSYTNILTVKLFARLADEDAYVREVIDEHQDAMGAHMRLISQFMFWLAAMNAALLTGTAAIGIWLWANGTVSAGVVATALPLAWQIANVAGWVSWEVTGIFENIGVVQEGMQTIAVPLTGVDRPDAVELEVPRGEIRFEDVSFSYGRSDARAGARPPRLHHPPRRARRPRRPLGRRQVDARQPAAALLRAGAGPHPASTARTSATSRRRACARRSAW